MNQPVGSQFGEDLILAEIFGGRGGGYCVEVGAYDGLIGSATYQFEQLGWHCLLIEPLPAFAERIRANRTGIVVNCAVSDSGGVATMAVAERQEQMSTLAISDKHRAWVESLGGTVRTLTVPTATLDRILEDSGFPELQFVTIDVEGHELAVLRGFSLDRYRPRVVIIEDNSVNGNRAVGSHMRAAGYVHYRRTGVNEWWARADDAELVRPDAIRRFRRAVRRERWGRRRRHFVHALAFYGGRHLPRALKRRIRAPFDTLRRQP